MTNKFEEMKVKRQLELQRPPMDLAIAGVLLLGFSFLALIF